MKNGGSLYRWMVGATTDDDRIDASVDITGGLAAAGYAIVPGISFVMPGSLRQHLTRLRASYRDLPLDVYLPDGGQYRYRRYGLFGASALSGFVQARAGHAYYQPPDVNRFTGGLLREFEPLDPAQRDNPFLVALLRFNVARLPGRRQWHVDVHLVRVTASPGLPGQPAPEGIHRDGFDFVSIHLMETSGVAFGGVTQIIGAGGEVLAERALAQPLDSVYLDDRALKHYVTPIAAVTGDAYRDVLLVSYRGDDG